MSSKPGPQLRHSIPGYNPSRPILSRGNKIFLMSLLVAPTITYGIMKVRQQQVKDAGMQLEVEGRAQWENTFGKGPGATVTKENGDTG